MTIDMRKQIFSTLIALFILQVTSGCTKQVSEEAVDFPEDVLTYVDPWIGTGGHGHVFVGASVPWGMVQLGPTGIPEGWDWVSGYHVSDSTIIGFSHTHMSGTGIGDLLDVTVMPVTGEVTLGRGTEDDPNSGHWSYSDRRREVVRPGFYGTHLLRYDVDVELTATTRVGLHRYTFPKGADRPAVVFDLVNGGNWDKPTDVQIRRVDDHRIEGYRRSTGWAKDQKVYFVAEFSEPISDFVVTSDGEMSKDEGEGTNVYARADIALGEKPLMVKVALSPTGIEGAWKNMESELPGWDFEKTKEHATNSWAEELGKIRMIASSKETMRVFYTALYHTMIAPSVFADVDGAYMGADLEVHGDPGFTTRTTFSLWDTYRAAHPLMTLIHTDQMEDMVGTFLNIYDEQGKLPVWHFYGNETNTMVGNPGIPVLADAVLKGFVKDEERAYTAMKNSAMLDDRGQNYRKEYGYIPYDKMVESVAYDLEYALADWAVAQVAQKLGHTEDYSYFLERSKSYRHLFDPETGFMRGKSVAGKWNEPFSPFHSSHRDDDYCEGNAWQYTFLVPHDVEGLVQLFGDEELFLEKLDSLFTVPSEIEGENTSPDISGMIGQFAHGNEPSHHILYLYSMLGHQDKAAPLLRQVMNDLYHDQPDGLSGNEDVGQMSAWYILSAMGFYQPEPAGGRFYFGSPIIDAADLKVRDGVFEIRVHNNSEDNIYIQKVELNGVEHSKRWLDYEEIASGGRLDIHMGDKPNRW